MCAPVRDFFFFSCQAKQGTGAQRSPVSPGQQEVTGLAGGPVAQLGAQGRGGWRSRKPKALASLRESLSRPGSDQWAVIIPRQAGSW